VNILERLSKREKAIVYILITIVAVSLIYGLLLEPFFKYWNSLNREIRLVKVELQKSLLIIKDKKRIDEEYGLYADKLKAGTSIEQDMTYILNELETLARSSNLKIVSMRPKPPKDKEYYKRFIVEIETESDMSALMKFIYNIKKSPQLLKVDRLNLNTKSSQQGVVIRASMIISKVSVT